MRKLRVWSVVVLGAFACGACSNGSPAQPTSATAQPSVEGGKGSARVTNAPPVLKLKTRPAADPRTQPYPTIRGVAPLSVRFNLCPTEDVDMIFLPDGTQDPSGDSLNWQFNFGDYNSRPVVNPANGQFYPDVDQTCRVDHVYERPGKYTATLSVTDKHLEDQGRGVSAMARTTTWLTIDVFPNTPPEPTLVPAPVILTFINSGCCALSWTTTNATSVTITGLVGPQPPNGGPFQTTCGQKTLTATGPGGTAALTSTFVCIE